MILRQVESGDHLALLGALAHHRGIAARAERQRESIEQDRFAGAGLAGERGKADTEIDVQAIDQDDVADGKPSEHGTTDDRGRTTDSSRDSTFCPLSSVLCRPSSVVRPSPSQLS